MGRENDPSAAREAQQAPKEGKAEEWWLEFGQKELSITEPWHVRSSAKAGLKVRINDLEGLS